MSALKKSLCTPLRHAVAAESHKTDRRSPRLRFWRQSTDGSGRRASRMVDGDRDGAAREMATNNSTGFSYGDDVFLIDCVRVNRVLYDDAHDRRDDGPFKEYVWTEISMKVGKSGKTATAVKHEHTIFGFKSRGANSG